MAEKTEKATPKKLRDARKKGQVAKPQDFPSAVTFIASVALTLAFTAAISDKLAGYLISCFRLAPHVDMETQAGALFMGAIETISVTSLPIAGIVAIIGVLTHFLLIGPVFSFESMKFEFKKFNPVENLKQKFKFKTLFELFKSLFKIGIAAYIIYLIMKGKIVDVVQTASLPVESTAHLFFTFLLEIVIKVGVFYIGIAIIDLIYQRRVFAKEMKMEKFEVKQEYKDTEGSPEIKSRRRHMAQEIAYEEGPSAVRRARAVVTNPTHVAVAIGYEPSKYPAPFILAKGVDLIAEAIIKEAEKYNIPIMRDVPLARTLFETGEVYKYVPVDTYEAVAEILRVIGAVEEN